MKPLAHFDRNARRLCISLDTYDAQVLMYALNQFSREYRELDERARNWAKRMELLSNDIRNAL